MANPYISEVKYRSNADGDFIEITVDPGTDVSLMSVTIYNADGTVRSVNALGTAVATTTGKDIYVIDTATSATFNGLNRYGAVSLDDNGTVFEFISFTDSAAAVTATAGAAAGMTSTEVGTAGAGSSLETTDGGVTYYVQPAPSPGTIPCFVDGTMILTPEGERPVEALMAGDLVVTKDRGAQKLRWVGQTEFAKYESTGSMPIRIQAHAFGAGLPVRNLWVSPFHRLVIENSHTQLLLDSKEMLVPATHMQNNGSIQQTPRGRAFSYHHLLFDQHEIVFSDGLATESFHPTQESIDAFAKATQGEVLALFPELEKAYGPTVRPVVSPHEVSLVNPARSN